MAIPRRPLAGFLFYLIGAASALTFSESLSPPVPKAISEMRDAIMKGLGFHGVEDLKVSGFDVRDSLVGQSVAYEFDIEVDKKVLPFKLLEDVNRWDFVDLPIFHPAAENDEEEGALTERPKKEDTVSVPVLPPFQLAGPMELWIQDADDMRLALPHDVDAGTLRKVLLSDGAAVTVKGARSVSLRHPLELPLPLNRTRNGPPAASALLKIAKALRSSARSSTFGQQEQPLLSLRIVGPSSLTSSTSASPNNRRLKLKRLSPGLVELSSPSMISDAEMELSQGQTLWPITSLNGSESNLRGFEELLASVLGNKALEQGNFKLLKAHVSAHTYLKMSFSVEKKLLPHSQEAGVDWSSFPSWKTKPEKATGHFEVLARLEQDGKVVPERILEVQPVHAADSVMESVQIGNITMSKLPLMHPPPTYFAL